MISVLLPVHNGAATLAATLRSLSWQTDPDWEAVVVDDGSTDDSVALLENWGDPRLSLVRMPHRGLVAALNHGLSHCRGALVARLDADDLCHPRRLELQRRALEGSDLALVGSRVRLFPMQGLRSGFRRYERWLNSLLTHEQMERDLLVESPLVHPSVMVRRSWLERVDGYRDLDGPEDYDLWLRLHAAGARFGKVPEVLLYWRDHPERLTRQHPHYRKPAIVRLKVEALKRLRDPSRVVVWGAGDEGKRLARELRAQGIVVDAFADLNRGRLGQVIDGSPVFSPREPFDRALLRDRLHLAAVGRDGGRALVRAEIEGFGLVEGRDYVTMA